MTRLGINRWIVIIAVSFFVGRMVWALEITPESIFGKELKANITHEGSAAHAEKSTVKSHHNEEFSALIEEGMKNENALGSALQKEVGLSHMKEEVRHATENRHIVAEPPPPAQVASPGKKLTRAKSPKIPSYTDLSQARIAEEVDAAEK
ncbi:MAG: hypothetical protein C5B49_10200 [Bdellovibrio sp.]|nr:MAG: hypothetical protein C5B49_10200 [Bdellovibrio sp.]